MNKQQGSFERRGVLLGTALASANRNRMRERLADHLIARCHR